VLTKPVIAEPVSILFIEQPF